MPYRLRPIFTMLAYKYPVLLTAATWGWVEVAFFPQPMLLLFLAACMFINMLTGIMKSWNRGIETHKEGMQKSILKLGRYSSVLVAVFIMLNILDRFDHIDFDYTFFLNGTIAFLSFVELYSIFENIEALDPDGPLSFFIKPVLKFLRGRIKNNVAKQLEDPDNSQNPDSNENTTAN